MSYDYKVVAVQRVVDGDTVDVVIDVGFRLTTVQRIRVLGINTPERGQPNWAEAKAFTQGWLEAHKKDLRINTFKTDSFGRYLGVLYVTTPVRSNLGTELVDVGLAEVWKP